MKTSRDGINLIKSFEGLRLTAYPDPGTGGEPWTIGYGTTTAAGVGRVYKGLTISQAQAESMLVRSLEAYERGVLKALTRTPTQLQFDAMVSLAYNIGVGAFGQSSVARFFNAGDIGKAADAFLLWNKAGGKVMAGLERRRKAERALFLSDANAGAGTGPAAPPPAPPSNPPPAPPSPPSAAPEAATGAAIAKWLIAAAGILIAALAAWITKG